MKKKWILKKKYTENRIHIKEFISEDGKTTKKVEWKFSLTNWFHRVTITTTDTKTFII